MINLSYSIDNKIRDASTMSHRPGARCCSEAIGAGESLYVEWLLVWPCYA